MFLFCSACSILSRLFWDKKENYCVGTARATKGQSVPGMSGTIRTCTPPVAIKAGQSRMSGAGDLVAADKAGIVFFPLVSQERYHGLV